jgi:hypothetical protein
VRVETHFKIAYTPECDSTSVLKVQDKRARVKTHFKKTLECDSTSVMKIQDKRMLRGMFRPKRVEVVGGWRKLQNEECRNLNASPKIIRIIKSKRSKWAAYIVRMWVREMQGFYRKARRK